MLKRVLIIFFLLVFFIPRPVQAQEYKADYNVEYFLQKNGNGLNTLAKFTIKTINLRSDVFVKKFSLSFPKSFAITNLTARDDLGPIKPELFQDDSSYTIALEFSQPKVGRGSVNTFYLEFNQNNLFEVNGSIWEVILPTIENRGEGSYQVTVTLPDKEKKISIAKPKPDSIEGDKIIWNNPKTRTIYAAFGTVQRYALTLAYNLQNTQFTGSKAEVAFPPDMLHQKIYVSSIDPKPDSITLDQDGNYIGTYTLSPKEKKTIIFNGVAELSVASREDVKAYENNQLSKQESYLLTQTNYWSVKSPEKFESLKSPADIYHFIVQNFKYNYEKVASGKSRRMGAEKALENPTQPVCVEYTDTFVALAREQGIKSREVQGYAISQDSRLRPLSLVKDILHSWPEFYDLLTRGWVSVDPTWESTSGIDYFSSFDLNHIGLAIHGRDSEYPLPAGMYKLDDTRDVIVKTTNDSITDSPVVRISSIKVEKKINDTTTHKGTIVVENIGNIFMYNFPITIEAKNLLIGSNVKAIDILAPLEKKEIPFEYTSTLKNRNGQGSISAGVNGSEMKTVTLSITPFSYTVAIGVGVIVALIFGSIVVLLKKRKQPLRV